MDMKQENEKWAVLKFDGCFFVTDKHSIVARCGTHAQAKDDAESIVRDHNSYSALEVMKDTLEYLRRVVAAQDVARVDAALALVETNKDSVEMKK